jgi:hypothetical protein
VTAVKGALAVPVYLAGMFALGLAGLALALDERRRRSAR